VGTGGGLQMAWAVGEHLPTGGCAGGEQWSCEAAAASTTPLSV